jgi:redox-sensitive bicupin YhaK (pirin superfamily)
MKQTRTIMKIIKSKPTMEGAGVHLRRVFGNNEVGLFDPFLLLDDFRSDNPNHYLAGFPWHPHRGIETITYVLCGNVEHGDSMGNKGVITNGDTQWMTAGSGIIHQEMPRGDYEGKMEGFQLWANLPKSQKMMLPRYRDIKSESVPEVTMENGVKVKIIAGTVNGKQGPVKDIVIDPEYLDVTVPAGATFVHETTNGHTMFAYVIEGQGYFDEKKDKLVGNGSACLYGDGNSITVSTGKEPVRFLLISGKPIKEPVAWYGPVVMNTEEELEVAFDEYRKGTFIKHKQT